MDREDAFNILEISCDSSRAQIKKAYRRAAMRHHPDRGGCPEIFKKIASAYECLKHGTKKTHAQADHWSAADPARQSNESDQVEIYESDVNEKIMVEISLLQAFAGCQVPVNTSDGEYLIDIPHGALHQRCVCAWQASNSNRVIGIFVSVNTAGAIVDWGYGSGRGLGNTVVSIHVPATRLILGGWFDVVTPDGSCAKIRIPAGTQAHALIKIKDRGYWAGPGSARRGDLHCRVVPVIQKIHEINSAELRALKAAVNVAECTA